MAYKEEEKTAEKEASQIVLDHAILKNTITHNSISNILNVWLRRKING